MPSPPLVGATAVGGAHTPHDRQEMLAARADRRREPPGPSAAARPRAIIPSPMIAARPLRSASVFAPPRWVSSRRRDRGARWWDRDAEERARSARRDRASPALTGSGSLATVEAIATARGRAARARRTAAKGPGDAPLARDELGHQRSPRTGDRGASKVASLGLEADFREGTKDVDDAPAGGGGRARDERGARPRRGEVGDLHLGRARSARARTAATGQRQALPDGR